MQSTSASFAQLFITDLYVTSPVEQSLVICPDVTAVEANVPDKSNVMFKPETDTTVCVAFSVPFSNELDNPETVTLSPATKPDAVAVFIVPVPPVAFTFMIVAAHNLRLPPLVPNDQSPETLSRMSSCITNE